MPRTGNRPTVLRYFHDREVQYALPRMLLTALGTATLVRTVLDPERYVRLIRSPALAELMDAAKTLLTELTGDARGVDPRDERDTMAWRKRAAVAADRLVAAGLRVRADIDAATDEYVATRTGWNPRLRALAAAMLYMWEDVAPAGSSALPSVTNPVSGPSGVRKLERAFGRARVRHRRPNRDRRRQTRSLAVGAVALVTILAAHWIASLGRLPSAVRTNPTLSSSGTGCRRRRASRCPVAREDELSLYTTDQPRRSR